MLISISVCSAFSLRQVSLLWIFSQRSSSSLPSLSERSFSTLLWLLLSSSSLPSLSEREVFQLYCGFSFRFISLLFLHSQTSFSTPSSLPFLSENFFNFTVVRQVSLLWIFSQRSSSSLPSLSEKFFNFTVASLSDLFLYSAFTLRQVSLLPHLYLFSQWNFSTLLWLLFQIYFSSLPSLSEKFLCSLIFTFSLRETFQLYCSQTSFSTLDFISEEFSSLPSLSEKFFNFTVASLSDLFVFSAFTLRQVSLLWIFSQRSSSHPCLLSQRSFPTLV